MSEFYGGAIAPAEQRLSTLYKIAASAAAVLAIAGCSSQESNTSNNQSNSSETIRCGDISFVNASSDVSKYDINAFLPKGNVNAAGQEDGYVTPLFGKDGPLAGAGDKASMAAIYATITKPATDGLTGDKTNLKTFDYVGQFDTAIAKYSAAQGGVQSAEADCIIANKIMTTTGQFNAEWAKPGDNIVRVTPVRDKSNNNILSIKVDPITATTALNGIEFTSRDAKTQGFATVLITKTGEEYLKGVTVQPSESKSNVETGKTPAEIVPTAPVTTLAVPITTGNTANTTGNTSSSTGSQTTTNQQPSSQAKPIPTPLPIGCNPYVPTPNCK